MTISGIAEKAGVSIGTVDRVLHNRGNVSSKARQAVEAVIQEYGYTPNPLARTLKQNKEFTIGVAIPPPGSGSGYWTMVADGIKNAESALSPFCIKVEFAHFDRMKAGSMKKAVEDLIASKRIQALVVPPIMPQETEELSKTLEIPYVFIDSPLPKASPLTTIAQNPFQAGLCAAKIMKLLKGNGVFSSVRCYQDAYNLRERHRGFSEYFKNKAGCRVVESVCQGKTNTEIFDFMDNLFRTEPDISGIFATHTEGFVIGQYLSYTNRKEKVALISYDMQKENRQGLMEGNIDCIISQRPEYQGYTSLHELFKSRILMKRIPEKIPVPIDIIFRENAGDYQSLR
ncbi:substrate-binding domain-containing protein [Treponema sp.]|uniref:substrate-binding domain-containing protein n=1 Tax=Treponema sp. TaxID=166 RepID=UPI003F0FFB6C